MNVKSDVKSNLIKFTKKSVKPSPCTINFVIVPLVLYCALLACLVCFFLLFCVLFSAGTYFAGIVRITINVRMNTNIQFYLAEYTGICFLLPLLKCSTESVNAKSTCM